MIDMKIESRVPDITRELQESNSTGIAASRQRSVTSDPGGDSIKKPGIHHQIKASQEDGNQVRSNTTLNPIDIKSAVEKLNEFVRSQQRDVSFSVDKEANATVIKVFKTETGELIKQFPPDEILAMITKIRKNIGWLVDRKV